MTSYCIDLHPSMAAEFITVKVLPGTGTDEMPHFQHTKVPLELLMPEDQVDNFYYYDKEGLLKKQKKVFISSIERVNLPAAIALSPPLTMPVDAVPSYNSKSDRTVGKQYYDEFNRAYFEVYVRDMMSYDSGLAMRRSRIAVSKLGEDRQFYRINFETDCDQKLVFIPDGNKSIMPFCARLAA